MNEKKATQIAETLGGNTWQSGGDIWLVYFERSDGKFVTISDEVVSEYDDRVSFEGGRPVNSIVIV